ncbi:MAG: DUF4870 domain-containing protein [Actinomycetales bacterium]|nr:DUF4870 domain-containing protein [Actinomycetales bacterium]
MSENPPPASGPYGQAPQDGPQQSPPPGPSGLPPAPPPPPGYGPPGGYPPPGTPGYPAGGYPPGVQPPLSPADEKMWATLAHAGGIVFGFLAPLIVYLIFRERGAFVRHQSAEALNFQITVLIAMAVSAVLSIILIGIFMMIAIGIAVLVLCIMAALAANRGEYYRYPMTIRFVS